MGLVGLGAIGAEIARRAKAFGLTIRAVDRFPERVLAPEGVEAVWGTDRLPELLAWSDFVVIAAPHTPETERLFDATMLAHMKPGGYLINIGRGAIVVLDDLVAALRAGTIAGAALDVYEIEPLPRRSPPLGFQQHHPHPPHRRLLAGHRPSPPGDTRRERPPVRRG